MKLELSEILAEVPEGDQLSVEADFSGYTIAQYEKFKDRIKRRINYHDLILSGINGECTPFNNYSIFCEELPENDSGRKRYRLYFTRADDAPEELKGQPLVEGSGDIVQKSMTHFFGWDEVCERLALQIALDETYLLKRQLEEAISKEEVELGDMADGRLTLLNPSFSAKECVPEILVGDGTKKGTVVIKPGMNQKKLHRFVEPILNVLEDKITGSVLSSLEYGKWIEIGNDLRLTILPYDKMPDLNVPPEYRTTCYHLEYVRQDENGESVKYFTSFYTGEPFLQTHAFATSGWSVPTSDQLDDCLQLIAQHIAQEHLDELAFQYEKQHWTVVNTGNTDEVAMSRREFNPAASGRATVPERFMLLPANSRLLPAPKPQN